MARTVEMWSLVLAGSLLAGAGCSREEASTTNGAVTATATPVAPATPDLTAGYVATYPTMDPQPGRRRLLQQFAAYQAADAKSKELARLDNGAIVDLKASYQDWMLVAFQSGGQPTLGWIELKTNDSRATTATEADARAATAAPKTTGDAGAPTGGDAGTTGGDAGASGTGAGTDAGASGTDAGADAGTTGSDAGASGAGADAGAADGGTGRRKIELKRPIDLKK
ncbi:hypothetical protein WMF37_43455 [Sorangium sp. So ce291]|uniref:hypothetical protein n=1 Tax=Sorangium sp. So ce291 TaxID=3133294 RepID=UPI003F6020F6